MLVSLVTGRRWLSTVDYVRQLNLQAPTICFNGGVVVDSQSGRALHSEVLPLGTTHRIIAAWNELKMPVFVYRHSLEPPDVMLQPNNSDHPRVMDFIQQQGEQVTIVEDLLKELDWQPMRLMTCGSPQLVEACDPELMSFYTGDIRVYHTYHAEPAFLEVLPPGANKVNGLQWLCRFFDLSAHQLIAFGDHLNDLEMIQWAGLGVAMGNASPRVKAVADIITDDNDNDGIAMVLEKLLDMEN